MSDHYPVCITRQLPQKNHKTKPLEIKYRYFKNFDEKSFLKDLSESEISEVTKMNNPNDALGKLYSCFLDTLKKHAKMKSKGVKQQFKPSWFNDDIKEARKTREGTTEIKTIAITDSGEIK